MTDIKRFSSEDSIVLAVPGSPHAENAAYVNATLKGSSGNPDRDIILTVKSELPDLSMCIFNAFLLDTSDDWKLSESPFTFFISPSRVDTHKTIKIFSEYALAHARNQDKRYLLPVWVINEDRHIESLMKTITQKILCAMNTGVSHPCIDRIDSDVWAKAQLTNDSCAPITFTAFREKVISGEVVPHCPELSASSLMSSVCTSDCMSEELVRASRKHRQRPSI